MKTKKLKSFVIDRAKWGRGYQYEMSRLYNSNSEKMCCLGFLGRACGLNQDDMEQVAFPSGLEPKAKSKMKEKVPFIFEKNDISSTCGKLVKINDDKNITENEREQSLKEIFAENGVKVNFK